MGSRVLGAVGTVLLAGVLVTVLLVTQPWASRPATPAVRLPNLSAPPQAVWTARLAEGVVTQRVLDPGRTRPALRDRLLFDTLDNDGHLRAVDASSGAIVWETPPLFDARCVLGHPTELACLDGDRVSLFAVSDGRAGATFAVPAHVGDLAATDDGLLLVTYDPQARTPVVLHRLNWRGGTVWTRTIAPAGDYLGDTDGPRLQVEGDRVSVSAQGPGGSEDAHGRVVRWSDGASVTEPGSYAFVGTGALARLLPDQTTELLDPDGRRLASIPGTLLDLETDRTASDRPLVALTEEGVTRVDRAGARLWDTQALSLPTAACGRALLEAMDGQVTAVDLETGQRLWRSATPMSQPRLTCNATRVVATFDSAAAADTGDYPAATAYDLSDGRVEWQVGGLNSVFPTSVGILDAEIGAVTLYR